MTARTDAAPAPDTMEDVLNVAARQAGTSSDLAVAAGQVIAHRMVMGMAAALDPSQADHAEFGRMVPEKMEAFAAAGLILLEKSGDASQQMSRLATDAIASTTRAGLEMADCATPMALAEAQGRFAMACFDQAASAFIRMGMLALGAQEAAMAPIHKTVAANTKRLNR
jgi:hypothetical protein